MFTHLRAAVVLVVVGAGSSRAIAATAAHPKQEEAATTCRKLPSGKRIVRLSLKPDTNIGDLVAWISSITCKQFIVPGTIASGSKTVTIISPQLLTPEEAYRLFLDALDSVGLTVYRTGSFFTIIETAKAKNSPIPVEVPGPGQ